MRPIALPTLLLAAVAANAPSAAAQDFMTAVALPKDNPFAAPSALPCATPAFDTITNGHFLPALLEGMRVHRAEIEGIATQKDAPTFANTIEAMERAGALLTRVNKVFFNLTESTTNPVIQSVQAEVAPKLAQHQDAIWLDARLFARVEAVFAARESLADAEQKRLVERYHTAFVRNGARLGPDAQQRLRTINETMSTLTTRFQEYCWPTPRPWPSCSTTRSSSPASTRVPSRPQRTPRRKPASPASSC